MAVKKNPKQPDFDGLDAILDTSLDASGVVIASKFMEWVGNQQKAKAVVMKADRQFAEEQEALKKKQKGGKGDDT